jgi:hypothetical protein
MSEKKIVTAGWCSGSTCRAQSKAGGQSQSINRHYRIALHPQQMFSMYCHMHLYCIVVAASWRS